MFEEKWITADEALSRIKKGAGSLSAPAAENPNI